jgi:hypothetical protein
MLMNPRALVALKSHYGEFARKQHLLERALPPRACLRSYQKPNQLPMYSVEQSIDQPRMDPDWTITFAGQCAFTC